MESNETKILEYQMLAKVYTVPIHGIPIPCIEEYLEGWIKNSIEYANKQCEILLGDKQ